MMNWPFALWGGDGSDEGDDSSDDDGDDGEGAPPESSPITMTQAELDATVARAVSRATRKATKSMRTDLGFENQDDLMTFIKTAREQQGAAQTEAERAKAEAERDRQMAAQERQSLQSQKIDLAVDLAVVRTGVTDEAKLNRIRTLVRAELGNDVDADELSDEVAEAIAAVRRDVPSMFETQNQNFGSGDGGGKDSDVDTAEAERQKRNKQYEEEYARRGGLVHH